MNERGREGSNQNGLHAAVRVQMSMDASRVAWQTRCEPKIREEVKAYKIENN